MTDARSSEVTLVSGFPGFRARKLIEHLLVSDPSALVVALVHPKRLAPAEAAIKDWERPLRARLRLVEADPAAIDFGLAGREYRELTKSVTRVHHLYQTTDPGVARDVARTINIGGAREMLEFARGTPALRCLVHYSSTLVSGNRTGLVLEDELEAGQSFRSAAEETLAVAELGMRRSMGELPITVIRPAYWVGDTRTGEIGRFDGPYPLVVFLVSAPAHASLPLPPRADSPLNVVPVDYVVRAAHFIGLHPEAAGTTFQLVDPEPPSARRFLELVAERCGKRLETRFNPTALTKTLLGNPGVRLLIKNPRAVTKLISTSVSYDDRNARRVLGSADIICPPVEAYLGALVDFVERRVAAREFPDDDGGEFLEALR